MDFQFEQIDLAPCITEYVFTDKYEDIMLHNVTSIPQELWEMGRIGEYRDISLNQRKCVLCYLTKHSNLNQQLKNFDDIVYGLFSHAIKKYAQKHKIILSGDEGYQILKYTEGGFFKPHFDAGEGFSDRKVSGLLYLNDNYSGGELEFTHFNLKIKPKKNSIIFFPSNFAYEHTAHEIKTGEKLCIVTWFFSKIH